MKHIEWLFLVEQKLAGPKVGWEITFPNILLILVIFGELQPSMMWLFTTCMKMCTVESTCGSTLPVFTSYDTRWLLQRTLVQLNLTQIPSLNVTFYRAETFGIIFQALPNFSFNKNAVSVAVCWQIFTARHQSLT